MMEGRRKLQSFRDLDVYREAQRLMAEVHRVVISFPDHEKRGLVDQMRRASKSVGGLIAEGWGLRSSEKEFKNYLRRALGSANEMELHLDTAAILEYSSSEAIAQLTAGYHALGGRLTQFSRNWKT